MNTKFMKTFSCGDILKQKILLNFCENKCGTYIFYEGDDILYVGEGGAKAQDLKTRILQHFTPLDTGSFIFQNYRREFKERLKLEDPKLSGEDVTEKFNDYKEKNHSEFEQKMKQVLDKASIYIITCGQNDNQDNALKSQLLEKLFINTMKPMYNNKL